MRLQRFSRAGGAGEGAGSHLTRRQADQRGGARDGCPLPWVRCWCNSSAPLVAVVSSFAWWRPAGLPAARPPPACQSPGHPRPSQRSLQAPQRRPPTRHPLWPPKTSWSWAPRSSSSGTDRWDAPRMLQGCSGRASRGLAPRPAPPLRPARGLHALRAAQTLRDRDQRSATLPLPCARPPHAAALPPLRRRSPPSPPCTRPQV